MTRASQLDATFVARHANRTGSASHSTTRSPLAARARAVGLVLGALAGLVDIVFAGTAREVPPPFEDQYLLTTSRFTDSSTRELPNGIVLIDPELGLYKTLAQLEGVRLGGALVQPDGTVLLVDRGDFPRPGRILKYDPQSGTVEIYAEGGFLVSPTRMLQLPTAQLVVADEGSPLGTGALIIVDPMERTEKILSFEGHLTPPQDLVLGRDGRIYVLGTNIVAVDAQSGAQELLPVAGHWDKGMAIDLDADGNLLVMGRDGGLTRVIRVDPQSGAGEHVFSLPERMRDVHAETAGSFVYGQAGPAVFAVARKYPTGLPEFIATGTLMHGIRSIDAFDGIDLNVGAAAQPAPALIPVPQKTRSGFQVPPLPRLPAISILANKDTVTILNGPGPQDDEVLDAGRYPLITALKAAEPGSDPVIGIEGDVPGDTMSIGGGDSDYKAYVAHWGPVPMRFAVIGVTEDARIREFGLHDRMNDGTKNGGVSDAWFANLTIEARNSAAVMIPKFHRFGRLRFYRCHFAAGRENLKAGNYQGYGYRWGVRGHGRGRWDFRFCTFDPVEEHAIYLDSPQGDSYFQNIEHRGSGRTAIQIVNRSFDNPGPSGFGTLLFENVQINRLWGDGGSGITVAGHLGDVVFRNIQVSEDPEIKRSHGAIAVWTDNSREKGTYLYTGADGNLYSCPSVTIESLVVDLPNSDRSHVAISGVENVYIESFNIRGNDNALVFNSPYGTPTIKGPAFVDGKRVELDSIPIVNGKMHFDPCPLSQYPGFGGRTKVVIGDEALSDAAMDKRWCNE